MSKIRVNNITNLDNTTGPSIAGICTFNSTDGLVIPSGKTGARYTDNGENIVKNGLVCWLDAKYSYPGAATTITGTERFYTWYDMSGNGNDGQLKNGATYDPIAEGSISFDGQGSYVMIQANPKFNTNYYTVNLWIYGQNVSSDAAYSPYETYYTKGYSGTFLTDLQIFNDASVSVYMANSSGNSNSQFSNPGISPYYANKYVWMNVTVSVNKNIIKMYYNGSLIYNRTYNPPIQNRNIYLGSPVEGGYFAGSLKGKISHFLYYDRPISDAEVRQNYDALKTRFSLS